MAPRWMRRGAGVPSDPWSRRARVYRLQLPLERRALRVLVEMLGPRPQDSLLDIGTGTGAVLAELARSQAPPGRAVGLDRSPRMLARARGLPAGWSLAEGDALELPFPDASFEIVTASYLLHLLEPPERAKVIAEARRVLVPKGTLGAITVAPPAGAPGRWLSAPVRFAAARSKGALAGLRPLDPSRELRAGGFRLLEARRVLIGYPSLCGVYRRE